MLWCDVEVLELDLETWRPVWVYTYLCDTTLHVADRRATGHDATCVHM